MYRKVLILSIVLLMAMLATVNAQDDGVAVIPAGETVRIGLATDLSNLIPAPGQDIANGGELAIIQFNEAGDLLGFEVELIVEDDLCTGEGATQVANQFVSDPNLVAVVGHVCSGASIPASDIYEDARIPMVSPSSTASEFTARGYDVTNRTAFNDAIQGVVAANYMTEELGLSQIVVLHDNSSYGLGLASTVSETFEELGGTVLSFEAVDPEDQDYRNLLTVVADLEPELIYLGGYQNQAALITQQMDEVGLTDVIFFSADGVFTQDYLDLAGDSAEGTIVTFGAQEGSAEANEAFDAAYEEQFGVAPDELGPFHAQSYDAANVILTALQEVAEVDDDGNLVIDREALIEAVRAVELEGVSGSIACDEIGDCGTAVITALIAEDGEWVDLEIPDELQVAE